MLVHRTIVLCLFVALTLLVAAPASGIASSISPEPDAAIRQAASHAPEPSDEHQPAGQADDYAAGAEGSEGEHEESLWPTIARLFNFAVLVWLLTYFLKSPIVGYLASRSKQIRSALVDAATMRATAEAQLAEVERRMKALPGELEALRRRGAEEVAAEEARIRAAAEAERQRLLEHTRREIELQFRIAQRALMEEAAALAVSAARERLVRSITPDDHLRLLDRYTTQLGGAR